jgi:hypothetical protein
MTDPNFALDAGQSRAEDSAWRQLITDDLRSYAAAAHDLGISARHERGRWGQDKIGATAYANLDET